VILDDIVILKPEEGFALQMSRAPRLILATAALVAGTTGSAAACAPPQRPFLPQASGGRETYADLIRQDFETYFAEVQGYFRCLDEERNRAFVEAQEVSDDYAQFLGAAE